MVRVRLPCLARSRLTDSIYRAMMKDEENYHDPLQFLTERRLEHLKKRKKAEMNCERELGAYIDHNDLVFGFGRW